MTIKHIVISGGGPSGMISYGILGKLSQLGFWNIHDVESIWGCSIGAMLSVVLLLEYRWDWMDDFFIKRPWSKILDITPEAIFNINYQRGIIDETIIFKVLSPLFDGKDLDKHITLKEFYEFTKKDFHIFATNLNTPMLEKIDISHKNYPDMPVYRAVYMSLSIPGICNPITNEDGCFIDGGYVNHFPLMDCVDKTDAGIDEILGINLESSQVKNITNSSSLLEIMFNIARKLVEVPNVSNLQGNDKIKHIINCSPEKPRGVVDWWDLIHEPSMREEFINYGRDIANTYFLENSEETPLSKNND